ncbi:ABC transporter ATP-binding protein [Methylobacterium oxalidis]|uniref:Polyamine-transporting ATPase n=1 Tax=Methylobacterium oxalidis TaxID=944322 RepID=A0A512JC03_9HYPH|nr:ABC transporter ATP-binding protein [Methylobacterium oxalidis]GEP07477.1 polyamine-transporting ATPase [Methylobacterium oxalidis]GJE34145.1 Spermidine/putrescine import ATP-binding protein PotA [Methylobacterium oxalidis]GLS64533.1 polyamine-transporting ATPase [Methylobacterium oxalidis]
MQRPEPLIRIDRVSKTFGAHRAVDDVSLDLEPGAFLCLLGPSGCGKSTLLRLVAGFESPDAGRILIDGADVTGLPPHRRPVNMMFQSYALFPHMSVARNVAYGLQGLGLGRAQIAERVAALLRLVRLDGFAERRPDRLSGGQRQRVALARALAREPRVLLLDEPLGALDRALREETQGELRALQRRLSTAFVVVTHDAAEAMTLADRIGVMDRGRLVQTGGAADLYERPASRYVAGLLGDVNLIEGRLAGSEGGGRVTVETGFGPLAAAAPEASLDPGAPVVVAVRPERVALLPGSGQGPEGVVADQTYLGDRIRRQVRMRDGTLLRVTGPVSADPGPSPGAAVRLVIPPEAARVLAP